MSDFAFATGASKKILVELILLAKSIKYFVGPHYPIYCLWHGEKVEGMPSELGMAIYSYANVPFDIKKVGADKAFIIDKALRFNDKVMYVDCDVMFTGEWNPNELTNGVVTLSRHYTNNERAVGHFNSGYIGISDKHFPEWWNQQPKECPGSYGDQQCLDNWDNFPSRNVQCFSEQHNVGWWRYWDAPKYVKPSVASPEVFRMETNGAQILYNDAPLISVHSHLMRNMSVSPANMPLACSFNRIFLDRLKASTDERHQKLYQYIMANQPNI